MKKLILASVLMVAGCLLNASSADTAEQAIAPSNGKATGSKVGIWKPSYEAQFDDCISYSGKTIRSVTLAAPTGCECKGAYYNPTNSTNQYKIKADCVANSYIANDFRSDCHNGVASGAASTHTFPGHLYFYIQGGFNVNFTDNTTAWCPFIVGMGYDFQWWIGTHSNNTISPIYEGYGIYLPCYKNGENGPACGFLDIASNSGNGFFIHDFVTQLAFWQSGTSGHPNAQLVMQDDGNLVIYDVDSPIWSTHTGGHAPGNYQKVMGGDGNLVIYDFDSPVLVPIWGSGTGGGRYPGATCAFQSDGNLVISYNGKPVWASGTGGHTDSDRCTCTYPNLQPDGNLVIYDGNSHNPIWATNTGGHPNAKLVMQDDGNLVISDPGYESIWASGTSGYNGAWDAFQPDGNYVIYWGAKQ